MQTIAYPAASPLLPRRLPARRSFATAAKQDAYGWDYRGGHGGLVDENMIVLRKRMHDMDMAERNYEPPAEWMEWEKQCYTSYDADICEVVGVLQTMLMNTRPSVAIGVMAIVGLSVPTSAVLLSFHLVHALSSMLPGFIHF